MFVSDVATILFILVRLLGSGTVFATVKVISSVAEALSVTRITRSLFVPTLVGVPDTVPSPATFIQSGPEAFENV